MNEESQSQDIVADLPQAVAIYKREHGVLPEGIEFEPGFICAWNGHFYIHARATLPLMAHEKGIGFGLWVEVSQEEYDRYEKAADDDESYKGFYAEGKLANEWPGFENMLGAPVTVRTVSVNEKIYITDVGAHETKDVAFLVAVHTAMDDEAGIERIKDLVMAYMADIGKLPN